MDGEQGSKEANFNSIRIALLPLVATALPKKSPLRDLQGL
jgi:hypothetical protein